MAKHTFDTKHYRHHDMAQSTQERVGRVHALYCTPKHFAGRYSFKERILQDVMGCVADNARQSDFYATHDRTEDARGE